MNQKNTIVVLAIAGIVLAGVVIFFVVTNVNKSTSVPLAQKPTRPATDQRESTTKPISAIPNNGSNGQSFVEVKELGFKIPVDSSMASELTYKIVKSTIDSSHLVAFSSKALNAVNKFCEDGVVTIDKVSGTPSKNNTGESIYFESRLSDVKQFDGFFLFYSRPQDSCTLGKNVDLEKKVSDTIGEGFKNVMLIN